MLSDLGDGAEVHKKWAKVFVRNIVVEAIRALLTPLLLTGWRPNEHPAKMGMSETTLKWPSDWTMIGLIFKFKRLPDKKETMVNLFLVGPWPGALLLVPPPPPLAAPPSTPTFLISTWSQDWWIVYLFRTVFDVWERDTTCFPSTQWGAELKQSSKLDTDVKVAKLTNWSLFPGHK